MMSERWTKEDQKQFLLHIYQEMEEHEKQMVEHRRQEAINALKNRREEKIEYRFSDFIGLFVLAGLIIAVILLVLFI